MNPVRREILVGEVRDRLHDLPDESVHCVVTSPPYWGLRDYGVEGQIGLEASPDDYVRELVDVFREVRRALRKDGTLWLNLGDTYATGAGKVGDHPGGGEQGQRWLGQPGTHRVGPGTQPNRMPIPGLKPKDLVGIPWRVAFALQADGWWLRSEVIWHKPSCMPDSTEDRPTRDHEHVFLLTKSGDTLFWTHRDANGTRVRPRADYRWQSTIDPAAETAAAPLNWRTDRLPNGEKRWKRVNLWSGHDYFYDGHAIRTPAGRHMLRDRRDPAKAPRLDRDYPGAPSRGASPLGNVEAGANRRTVWTIPTEQFSEAHFATFPTALPDLCIKAGTSERGACASCGAPWTRVLGEPLPTGAAGSGNKTRAYGEAVGRAGSHIGRGIPWEPTTRPTIDWRASCACEEGGGPPVPCVVLDPFAGAFTTCLVAARLGRDWIGIEINPEYAEIGRRRLAPYSRRLTDYAPLEEVAERV